MMNPGVLFWHIGGDYLYFGLSCAIDSSTSTCIIYSTWSNHIEVIPGVQYIRHIKNEILTT